MFVEEQRYFGKRVTPHFELTHLPREISCCYQSMSNADGASGSLQPPRMRVTVTPRIAHSAIHTHSARSCV